MYKNINRCKWLGGEKKTKKLIKKLIEKTKPKNKKNKPIKKKYNFNLKILKSIKLNRNKLDQRIFNSIIIG